MSTLDEPMNQPPAPYAQPQPNYAQPQQAAYPQPQYGRPQHAQPQQAMTGYGQPVAPAQYGHTLGPVGKIRSTWAVIGLNIITLGLYSLYYYFSVHEEMKRHSGEGVGGAVGLVLALFTLGLVTPFLLPNEVGNLYARQGRARPVSATTGLWVLLGSLILVGPLVWLIKTNGALNAYWRSVGAA